MKNIKLLDCTLRDGGYYNRWDFSKNLISDYLSCMKDCSVDYIELGFRTLKNVGFKGACAYTKNEFINSVIKFSEPKVGIMINGSEILNNYQYSQKNVESLFSSEIKSRLKLIRIACHYEEINKILPICNYLKKKNYMIGINLMQISEIDLSKIKEVAKTLNNSPADVFYIADSLGALNEEKLLKILDCIKSSYKKEIGIHAHDNMEKALSNTITAIDNGVTWVDSTINGMGRGPGNVKTEIALIALDKYRNKKFDIKKPIQLIDKHFADLKNQYKWGTNPYYYYAAENKIHPTFIQTILEYNKYSPEEIISKIRFLSKQDSRKFSNTLLNENTGANKLFPGTWSPKEEIKDREVLILGNGPSIKKYKKTLEKYIKKKNPFVIALNIEKSINEKLINSRAACVPVRIFSDYTSYNKFNQTFILPLFSQSPKIQKKLKKAKIKNYGFLSKGRNFEFFDTYATSPYMFALAYALSIANSGEAKNILLAGIDGYTNNDALNLEMNELIKSYNKNKKSIKVISITPTVYKIKIKSVF